MKSSFVFDKKSGTLKQDVAQTSTNEGNEVKQESGIDLKPQVNVADKIVQMKRVDKITALQLVDENNNPESFIDAVTTGIVMFKEREDYSITQIVDEHSGKPLMYIGGYALSMKFNMAELNSLERVEQCVQGLNKLFRKLIMEQALNR